MGIDLVLKTVAVRDDGCFSVLLWKGRPVAVTVERTFDDGRPIIQNGEYQCVRRMYHKGGYWTFEILVKGHTAILFHKGNLEDQSLGCVLLGESFGEIGGKTAVMASGAAFDEFARLTDGQAAITMLVVGR